MFASLGNSANVAVTPVPLTGMLSPDSPTRPRDSNVTSPGRPSLATFQTSHPHSQFPFLAQSLKLNWSPYFLPTLPSPAPPEICFSSPFNLVPAYPFKVIQQTQSAYCILCTILVSRGHRQNISLCKAYILMGKAMKFRKK